jgi:hypothetical protein
MKPLSTESFIKSFLLMMMSAFSLIGHLVPTSGFVCIERSRGPKQEMLQREGAERTEPLAWLRVRENWTDEDAPSVGRFHAAPSILGGAYLYGFCPAWISDPLGPPALTNRDNPQHGWFPGMPFG